MGAPIGNKNAAKAKVWHAAILRALERRDQSRTDGIKELDALAEKLLQLVAAGDLAALKEFGDRLDGKPAQESTVTINRPARELSDDELTNIAEGGGEGDTVAPLTSPLLN